MSHPHGPGLKRPLVTPVMIVRDESRHLPGALASFGQFGDVLAPACLYDTGSVDDTRGIAVEGGARVVEGCWDDDFARARNAALEMADTAWVVVVDADERLVGDAAMLANAVRQADAHGAEALITDLEDLREDRVVNTASAIRLFRRDAAQYRGVVHEVVVKRGGGSLRVATIPREAARVVHIGYEAGASMERRYERNTRLGDLDVAAARQSDDVDRLVQALVNRGRSRKLGRDVAGATSDWEEARALPSTSAFRLFAGEYLVEHLIESGQYSAAATLLKRLKDEGCDPDLLAWHTGELFARTGHPEQAYASLRLVEQPRTALGERVSVAPALQSRMLLGADLGHHEQALADAVQLMAGHGVYGFARLALLLWAPRPPADLAARLRAAGGKYAEQLQGEFGALGDGGAEVADALLGVTTTEPAVESLSGTSSADEASENIAADSSRPTPQGR